MSRHPIPQATRSKPSPRFALRPTAVAVHLLLAGMAIGGWVGAAQAQTAATASTRSYNIPAGPLNVVLTRFLGESGVLLSGSTELAQGKQSPGVQGKLTPDAALAALLAGTGLQAVADAQGRYVLRPAPVSDKRGEVTLPVVTVKGDAERESAWGPVTGYVAKRSATGMKTDTPLAETPQSISVIGAEEIQDRKAVVLEEVLRYTPGVVTRSADILNSRIDNFQIRGFEAANNRSLLDGLKYKANGVDAQVEPYGMERVEVLRGPASVLYGQIEPGGMLNAVSKRPPTAPLHEVGVEVGSWNRLQLTADVGGPLNADGSLLYRLTMLGRSSETQIDRSFDDRVFIAPALTWKPDAATSVTLFSSYSKAKYSYYWVWNQIQNPGARPQPSAGLNMSGDGSYQDREQKALGYVLEHALSVNTKLRQTVRYSETDISRPEVWVVGNLSPGGTTVPRAWTNSMQDSKIFSADTSVEHQFSTGNMAHTLIAGVDFQNARWRWHETWDSLATPLNVYMPDYSKAGVVGALLPGYNDTKRSRQGGFYLQDQIKFGRWALTVGSRYDRVTTSQVRPEGAINRNQTDSKLTGRAGLVYLFDSGWAPYVSYATSFAPELGNDRAGNAFKPTEGQQTELGIRYAPADSRLYFAAAVFDLKKQNALTTDPVNASFRVQRGEITSRGLELEARAELTRNVSVIANYTYLDNFISKSNTTDLGWSTGDVPKHAASVWTKYSATGDWVGAFAAFGVRYAGASRSSRDSTNSNFNPNSTLLDIALGYDQGPWRYAFNVNNLADKQYLYSCNGTWCAKSVGRDMRMSATYRF